jgi:hypothetical protein
MRMSQIAAESLESVAGRYKGRSTYLECGYELAMRIVTIGCREFSGARETRDTCYAQRRAECSR